MWQEPNYLVTILFNLWPRDKRTMFQRSSKIMNLIFLLLFYWEKATINLLLIENLGIELRWNVKFSFRYKNIGSKKDTLFGKITFETKRQKDKETKRHHISWNLQSWYDVATLKHLMKIWSQDIIRFCCNISQNL